MHNRGAEAPYDDAVQAAQAVRDGKLAELAQPAQTAQTAAAGSTTSGSAGAAPSGSSGSGAASSPSAPSATPASKAGAGTAPSLVSSDAKVRKPMELAGPDVTADPGAKPVIRSASAIKAGRRNGGYGIATEVPDEFRKSTMDGYLDALESEMNRRKPLSDEEIDKLRRKRRTDSAISGVSDALRAVANLVATHNYAPNAYDADHTMSAKTKERWDKLAADRKERDKEYLNYALNLGKLRGDERDRAYGIWQYEQQRALQDRQRGDALAAAEREAQLKAAELARRLDKDETDALVKQSVIAANNARANKANEDAKWVGYKAQKTGRGHGGGHGGGGSKGGKYAVYDVDGNLVATTNSKSDADDWAKAIGSYVYTDNETTTVTKDRKGTKTTTVTKGGGYRMRGKGANGGGSGGSGGSKGGSLAPKGGGKKKDPFKGKKW